MFQDNILRNISNYSPFPHSTQLCFLCPEWITACRLNCSLRLKAFKQWQRYGLSGLCDCLWRVRWSFRFSAALHISQTNRRSMFWWPIMCWSRISLKEFYNLKFARNFQKAFGLLLWICNLTFRTHEQHWPIESKLQSDFASFRSRFLLLWRFLLFLLFRCRRDSSWLRLHVVNDLRLLNRLNDVSDWCRW